MQYLHMTALLNLTNLLLYSLFIFLLFLCNAHTLKRNSCIHCTKEMNRGVNYTARFLARTVPVALVSQQIIVDKNTKCASFSAATYPANDPIEDRHVMQHSNGWAVGAVFDGHGGWQVSDFASRFLVDKVLTNITNCTERDEITLDEQITAAFNSMEHDILGQVRPAFNVGFGDVAKVGSCVLLALKKADRLVIANCGDCRAILGTAVPTSGGKQSSTEHYVSTRINRDHNARVALEQLRLEQDHVGEEGLYRCKNSHACYVKGRLQLTRSLGDVYLKSAEFNGSKDRHRSGGRYIPDPYTPPYVSHQPDLHHIRLGAEDRFVILASDGLWDYLSDQEAVQIVASCMPPRISTVNSSDTAAPAGQPGSWYSSLLGTSSVSPSINKGSTPSSTQSNSSTEASAGVARWELLAAERLVQRALEIAAAESGLTLQQLRALPIGRARRSRHDDTTAVVMFF